MPLARYLATTSRYLVFDIVAEPIDWCRQKITTPNTAMEFDYVGMKHELYIPQGKVPSDEGFRNRLPDLTDW